jgi:aspartyl-tRNA(Asn)/glutamyl-tRNA(Gln) amidotransferase subunit A
MMEALHTSIEDLTLAAARSAVIEGRISAVALAEQHYDRIAAVDGGIHSYLSLTRERALAQAERVDAAAKAGDPLGPLAGVPVGIKDVLALRGTPTTAGSRILEGYRPPYDATVVKKLEAAGAVLLGKLNCDEFAMGSSNENSAYGPVHNPRALDRVPGGSSDGHWRVDPPAGSFLRRGRGTPNLWTRLAIWPDCVCFFAGSCRAVCSVCC